MRTLRTLLVVVAAMTTTAADPARARDWFVRAGSTGDGSREKPFGDPWEALEKCEAGDAIHIAEGRYTGKLQSGHWAIPFDGVQLLGGYSADWSKRDPWTFKTQLVWDRNSKNFPLEPRILATVKGVAIDGLVLDGMEQNEYSDDARTGRTSKSLDSSQATVRLVSPGTVRNCVFVNSGREGLVCPNGSTVENNLFLNTFDSALKINGLALAHPDARTPAVVRNNTFAWSWCDRAPATGRYSGAAIQMGGPATITQNIFAHCDNNAVYCTINPDRTTLSKNVFFMNLWSNLKIFIEGRDIVVDSKTMDLLEECGLKAFEGNQVVNPELPLDSAWLDAAAKRTAAKRGKVEMDDWNKLRSALGLPLVGTGGAPASGVAPAYPLEKALSLLAPRKADLKAGARAVPLEAKFGSGAAAAPERIYERVELTAWARQPDKADGKALEMVVAISSVANIAGIPETYKKDEHEGVFLHDGMGQERITGFYRKGSAVNRTAAGAVGKYGGSGKADRLWVVKGVAHAVKSIPKAAFFVESIAPYEAAAGASARKRATGRDWFVRAGASGGDGSREKPFRDPFQPLERCEAGDTIHVAGGEYVGKLRAGTWRVDTTDIALLGGYDAEFKERDPWKYPTLLHCPEDFKGRRGGYTLEGADDHTGCIVDGFVFDKRLNNKYLDNGDLKFMDSDKTEHLWLSRPDCAVRNCVFVNGAQGAVRLASGQTVENCIFMNHHMMVVSVERGHAPEIPFLFRNNTLAFAWEKRFGSGHGVTADLLLLGGGLRAVVDGNIFAFADQHAIRLDADPKDVELTNNVFSTNLFAEVYRTAGTLFVDNKTFGQLRDLGWKRLEDNVLLHPGLPLDEKWFNVYLNRTAYVPGKVTMDDWNKIRELLGQPVLATGGKPAEGMARAYDYKKAAVLFPKNEQCKAGARPRKLDVKFEGVVRQEPAHEYAESSWDVAKDASAWDKLDGKRVMLKVSVKGPDNQWFLPDVRKEEYAVFSAGGDSGLPMRIYVLRGTRHERACKQAKPEDSYLLKGVARRQRQMVVEAIEKSD